MYVLGSGLPYSSARAQGARLRSILDMCCVGCTRQRRWADAAIIIALSLYHRVLVAAMKSRVMRAHPTPLTHESINMYLNGPVDIRVPHFSHGRSLCQATFSNYRQTHVSEG